MFWIPSPNSLLHQINCFLGCKPYWSAKRKKNVMLEVVARTCSAKKLFWKFHKIHGENLVLESLSNNVAGLQTFVVVLQNRCFTKFIRRHLCCQTTFLTEHLAMTACCVYLYILRSSSEYLFYRTTPGDCLFHAQIARFQPACKVR